MAMKSVMAPMMGAHLTPWTDFPITNCYGSP
jgi:hypothetical protein